MCRRRKHWKMKPTRAGSDAEQLPEALARMARRGRGRLKPGRWCWTGPGDRPPRPPYDNVWFRAAGPVPR